MSDDPCCEICGEEASFVYEPDGIILQMAVGYLCEECFQAHLASFVLLNSTERPHHSGMRFLN